MTTQTYRRTAPRRPSMVQRVSVRLIAMTPSIPFVFVDMVAALFGALFLYMLAERVQILADWWRESHRRQRPGVHRPGWFS